MTIRGLDPGGELGKLFFQIQSKEIDGQGTGVQRTHSSPSSADAVNLSNLAQEIHDYTSRAAHLPEVRADQLQRIQQKLEAGRDLATPEQLATAMMRDTIMNSLRSS